MDETLPAQQEKAWEGRETIKGENPTRGQDSVNISESTPCMMEELKLFLNAEDREAKRFARNSTL
jgi:hypothetical protein